MLEKEDTILNKKLLVSIIVPVYKVEEYLNNCLDSIITQTYKNLEILLVDDGSPDKCANICDEYALNDKRITVIHKQNSGLSDARNAGIKAATGDYILFVDSDDKLAQSVVVENLVEFLLKTESTVTYCPNIVRTKEDGSLIIPKGISKEFPSLTPEVLLDTVLQENLYLAAWAFVVRRSFILKYSLYFIEKLIYEDMEWIPRLLFAQENLRINIFTEPFYIYCKNSNSITSSFTQLHFDSMYTILLGLVEKLYKNPKGYFIKTWFNINLCSLFMFFEKDCLLNTDFYKSNIIFVKELFKTNYKYLNSRNRIILIFQLFDTKLFFILRKWAKRVLRK